MASKKKYKKYQEINFTYPGRKDFLALFNAYKNHEIDFQTFHDNFSSISIDNYQDFFNKKEYSAVSELDEAVSWYTPDSKELKISNFKSRDQVEESFQKVISILNINSKEETIRGMEYFEIKPLEHKTDAAQDVLNEFVLHGDDDYIIRLMRTFIGRYLANINYTSIILKNELEEELEDGDFDLPRMVDDDELLLYQIAGRDAAMLTYIKFKDFYPVLEKTVYERLNSPKFATDNKVEILDKLAEVKASFGLDDHFEETVNREIEDGVSKKPQRLRKLVKQVKTSFGLAD
ncbi:hypothetical protein [Weissella minor]|uniref:hypothetical protein n=1 Tax=Weissella minor TaxID=1620 RepID=UPI003AF29530